MDLNLTISNYRCFPRSDPARVELRRGFTAVVGANNAGKSALLRFFWEFRPLFTELSKERSDLQQAVGGFPQYLSLQVRDTAEVFCDAQSGDLTVEVEIVDPSPSDVGPPVTRALVRLARPSATYTVSLWSAEGPVAIPKDWYANQPRDASGTFLADVQPLRDAAAALARCYYMGNFRSVQQHATGSDFDVEIGGALIARWRVLKGGESKASRLTAATVTARLRDIFDLKEFDIDVSDSGQRLIATVDGETYGFDELGSGLSHFSVALVNLVAAGTTPSWLLVDEPENGLHPTLQLEFLTTLANHAAEGVVFATHNYGLARRLTDQIYTVRRDRASRTSTMRPHRQASSLAEFLGELGFSGYRDLGFELILLVEGPTDVPTVSELLHVLGITGNVVLLPLGGNTGINGSVEPQLREILRISDRVAALVDSERPSGGAALHPSRVAFKKVCDRLGVRCHILGRRAIENYFTQRAVQAAFGEAFSALGPNERLDAKSPRWSKRDNWRIARQLRRGEVSRTDLGQFLLEVTKSDSRMPKPEPSEQPA